MKKRILGSWEKDLMKELEDPVFAVRFLIASIWHVSEDIRMVNAALKLDKPKRKKKK